MKIACRVSDVPQLTRTGKPPNLTGMNRLKQSLAVDTETLSLDLITFLAQDEERFERFLALSGLGPHDFRTHLAEPAFQAMVLDQVLQDQNLVLEFTAAHNLKPETVLAARRKLPGGFAE
jgi:hypothetical protein